MDIKKEVKMQVSKVWITPFEKNKFRGYANISFSLRQGGNGCFTISGFSLFADEQTGQINVAMPSKPKKEGNGWDPIMNLKKDDPDSNALYNQIQEEVRKAYNKEVAKRSGNQPQQQSIPSNQSNMNGSFQHEDLPF